jgi:general secretion pathway protein G
MTLLNRRTAKRRGFTLVELLVVIVIVGIIVSLITVAVIKALSKGGVVALTSELRQFNTGVENFKTKFGYYPPSRIILCENYLNYYNSNTPSMGFVSQLHADSFAFLNRIFPRINWSSTNGIGATAWVGIDWNGNGTGPDPAVLLEGDQCLVFFLGGIPSPPGPLSSGIVPTCSGFSTNPNNPAYHVLNGGDTIPPFQEFATSRLTTIARTTYVYNPALGIAGAPPPVSPWHYSYLDTYGKMPYAYFSSNGQRNGYTFHSYYSILLTSSSLLSSDCTTLSVWPYAEKQLTTTTLQYLNPSSFQVISAGGDGVFGRGTDLNLVPPAAGAPSPYWTIATIGNASTSNVSWDYSSPTPNQTAGFDDQSNFSGSPLGVAP